MIIRRWPVIVVLCLACLNGCSGARRSTRDLEVEAILDLRHRGIELFYAEKYAECVQTLVEWLRLYEPAQPDLAASVRFHVALAYLKLGETGKAKAAFVHICRAYAGVPDSHPAAKWRRWAHEELDRLGK